MLFKIEEGLWFDNEHVAIYKAKELHPDMLKNKNQPSVGDGIEKRREDWRPTLIFLSTTTCNLRCKYCFADCGSFGVINEKKSFSFDDYVQAYTKMYSMFDGISSISFFGGEPLINFKEIRKFVKYLYSTYSKDRIPSLSVNTNATIMNPEIMAFLKEYNFIIGTSVDGPKAAHDSNRIRVNQSGTYDQVIDNLKQIKENDLNIITQYTFTKQHLDLYEKGMAKEWYEGMESLPINNYDLIPVSTADMRHRIDMKDPETVQKYTDYCEETAEYYLNKILNEDISKVPRMFMGLFLRIMTRTVHRDCSAGYSFSITPDGNVFPCHGFAGNPEFAINMNDLNAEDDFSNNPWFKKVREMNRLKVTKCQDCISKTVCGAWCKALVFNVKGELNDVLEERCLLINTYTRKIVSFLVHEYPNHKEQINRKVIEYNRAQKELEVAYES
ncbi:MULTISPECIES: radical SAM/SPASM domain-containing protein [Paenibacillus]|uniref:Thioether cross-link-forming SCIFF peptide maturase n=1 Tax=Paenibacillus azoreducens TaxID=116718 RepID=A0A919YEE4_9BACL|nr:MULTISPECIES: radical SAM protein [Paenibacillus]MBE9915100.1 radical SAM protein [Paenibacillus donghaensis]GIO49204.1 thioether cross-link-forming SCIFF peptide maturase [Paenibacillus azoreducens]